MKDISQSFNTCLVIIVCKVLHLAHFISVVNMNYYIVFVLFVWTQCVLCLCNVHY